MRRQEDVAIRELASLKAGRRTTRSTRKEYLLQDQRIKKASDNLITGRWQVPEFLNETAITVSEYEQRMIAAQQDGQLESENEVINQIYTYSHHKFLNHKFIYHLV